MDTCCSKIFSIMDTKIRRIWLSYYNYFSSKVFKGKFSLPHIPDQSSNNAHMFYLVCNSQKDFLDSNSNSVNSRVLLLKKLLINIKYASGERTNTVKTRRTRSETTQRTVESFVSSSGTNNSGRRKLNFN